MTEDAATAAIRRARDLLPGIEGPPHVLGVLSDGYTNSNHLVQVGGERVVVRVGNPQSARLGIDRMREERVWRAATAAALSPALLAFDARSGDAVSVFVDAPSAADVMAAGHAAALTSASGLSALARALRRTHALAVPCTSVDPADSVQRYLDLRTASGARWPDWVPPLLARLRARPSPVQPALTHHDFNPWNLLWLPDAEVQVLDWEYAGLGDPWFDVVTVFAHWSLDAEAREHLLVELGADAVARARLPALETLFHLREYAWAGAMAALGDTNPNVQAQFEREADWLLANA